MSRNPTSYLIRIAGYEQVVEFDCEDDIEAILIAMSAQTPLGHGLWSQDRFIAWIEAAPPETRPRGASSSPLA